MEEVYKWCCNNLSESASEFPWKVEVDVTVAMDREKIGIIHFCFLHPECEERIWLEYDLYNLEPYTKRGMRIRLCNLIAKSGYIPQELLELYGEPIELTEDMFTVYATGPCFCPALKPGYYPKQSYIVKGSWMYSSEDSATFMPINEDWTGVQFGTTLVLVFPEPIDITVISNGESWANE